MAFRPSNLDARRMSFFYNFLGKLEHQTLWDTMTKEVVGINLPKIVFTRTWDERWDSAVSEIGNTVTTFGIGGLLDRCLQSMYRTVQSQGAERARQWAVLGRTGALYSTIFSLMWAMPFVRNYVTTRRTGKTSFTDVIGAKNSQNASRFLDARTSLAADKRHIRQILGLGAIATVLCAGGGLLAAKRMLPLGILKRLFTHEGLQKNLLLKDGSFINGFSGLKAVLFWGVPAYAGWYQASRDPYEKKEQRLKFVSFVAGFSGPGLLLGRYFKKTFEQLLPPGVEPTYRSITEALSRQSHPALKAPLEQALSAWKKKNLWTLLSSIGLLSATQLLNFHLTGKRLARARQAGARSVPPAGNLHRKTIANWGLRPALPIASPWQGASPSYQAAPYGPRW
jgi:hypothetical protein